MDGWKIHATYHHSETLVRFPVHTKKRVSSPWLHFMVRNGLRNHPQLRAAKASEKCPKPRDQRDFSCANVQLICFLKNLQKWRFQLLAPRITPTKKGVASKHRKHPNRFVSKQKPQLLVQLPSFQEGRAPSDRARFASHSLTRRFSEPAHQPAHLICDSPKTRKRHRCPSGNLEGFSLVMNGRQPSKQVEPFYVQPN